MNETLKRAISGVFYVIIMWFGASYSQLSFTILFTTIGIFCTYEIWKLRKGRKKTIAFLYILTPFILIQFISTNQVIWNPNLILFILLLTWTFDTFAYLIGVRFGKHKIKESISPKKSWEGFLGGFIFTIITAYLSHTYFKFETIEKIVIISIILPFTATLGDFIASYYKRQAKVKDSGNIIPGHGGMLDRMDAFTITIPTIYIIVKILNETT